MSFIMRKGSYSNDAKTALEKKDMFREALLRRHYEKVARRQAGMEKPKTDPYALRFGSYIRTARVQAGLSYEALSLKTGIDRGLLRAIEVGLFAAEDLEAQCVKKLAAALQEPAGRLFLLLGRREPRKEPTGSFCLLTPHARITIEPHEPAEARVMPRAETAENRTATDKVIVLDQTVVLISGNHNVNIYFAGAKQNGAEGCLTYLGMGWKHARDKFRPEREFREPDRQFMDK